MEAVLMQQTAAAAAAGRRCVGKAALAGNRWQAVRLAATARCGASWGVRARPGLARAQLVAEEQRTEIAGDDDDARAMRLFVGLPADVVSCDGTAVSRPRAIRAGLRALKLLGVDGVELPVSWAVVQPGSEEQFEWTGYLAVTGMVRDAGLSLRVSLLTHGRGATLPDEDADPGADTVADAGSTNTESVADDCTTLLDTVAGAEADTALPGWVADALAADPDILFTDRSGNRRKECLSFAVDDLAVLAGKSPIQAYEAFFRSFADAFQDFLGSTVTDVTVSLGPDGELRYPSYPPGCDRADGYAGDGEFQCYDKHTLARLKQHADSSGRPLWGLAGPHDAPRYDDPPESSGFFRGSWQTEYGNFFLSWYARELLAHGDRVLAAATRVFFGKQIELSAKVPFLRRRSRPAEATAGLHRGYGPVAEMFARHDCTVLVSGMMDAAAGSEAEEVLAQIKDACTEHGARLAYENASLVVATDGAGPAGVWGGLLTADRTRPCHFTYQRMGAEFFSPDHWPMFVQFARDLEFPEESHEDDLPADGGQMAPLSGRVEHGAEKEAQLA
ncbi:inactive beta-amylase 9-like [Lolium perenne]|uniref:inactive beta-amylase 9-like n=1 Tax=Lolium perenne TaxID=4522 RepID=UPI0021EB11C2|nr:inactive beta-amylase 9-like [Lolium perenne]